METLFHTLYGRESFMLEKREQIVIFNTDRRQQYLAERYPGIHVKKEHLLENFDGSRELGLLIREADKLILPTPVKKLLYIPGLMDFIRDNILINREEGVVERLEVWGGILPEEWIESFREWNVNWYDFMKMPQVQTENAKITAEATLMELIAHGHYALSAQKILLTGYGKCAKEIALRLLALGAKVTVLARKREARMEAKSDGCQAVDFSYGPEEAYGSAVVVNTVPAMVVTEKILCNLPKDAWVLDIASAPGGCDKVAADHYGIPVREALGLPGRYLVKSSAEILYQRIRHEDSLSEKERYGDQKPWIFQI